MDFVNLLKDNWQTIASSPWVFLVFAVFFSGVGLALGRLWRTEIIATLYSRIEHRDERITDLQRRVAEFPLSTERKEIRRNLALVLHNGITLREKYREIPDNELDAQLNSWVNEAGSALEELTDESYIVRFMDDTSRSAGFLVGSGTQLQKTFALYLDHRIKKLTEILKEFS